MLKHTIIAFSGSHRTGKTSLGYSVHNYAPEIEFIKTKVSSLSLWDSILPDSLVSFAERIYIQELIYKDISCFFTSKIATYPEKSILFDRSPLDIAAYLLSNIDSTTSSLYNSRTKQLITNCVELTKTCFNYVFIIPPVIPFIPESGKASKVYSSLAYRLSLHYILLGLCTENNIPHKIIKEIDLDKRTTEVLHELELDER